jgi:hypothetical protein
LSFTHNALVLKKLSITQVPAPAALVQRAAVTYKVEQNVNHKWSCKETGLALSVIPRSSDTEDWLRQKSYPLADRSLADLVAMTRR